MAITLYNSGEQVSCVQKLAMEMSLVELRAITSLLLWLTME